MAGYQPLKVAGYSTGLVEEREEFLLPDDAYPRLQNAYVWRERIKRKKAYQLLGRLRRIISTPVTLSTQANGASYVNADILADPSFNLRASQPNAQIEPGSVTVIIGAQTYQDTAKNGQLSFAANTGTINYATGALNISFVPPLGAPFNVTVSLNYFPSLPVMGIRIRENQDSTNDQTVFFDTIYAYSFNSSLNGFQEFLPGTTWTGSNSQFFWTTNYWVGDANKKIFWETNNNDPIRYCNGQAGTNWQNFSPIIDASGNHLINCLALLPFRGRLVAFNTHEGTISPGSSYSNRIRWAAIGTPFTTSDGQIVTTNLNPNAWRDDIRGQGGFLDIPTSEDIVSVGFVRDNLVIYCERSTWQLRYTGRTIAPFQIEKVNSELGAESTFSTIQFDTSLVGIGDKGIVECDSFKSERIDIKIPDFVFNLSDSNNATARIQGIRDFEQRLAFFTVVSDESTDVFPDTRLMYNYENDSWALFTDSLTALGSFQLPSSRTWLNTHKPWIECNFPWISFAQGSPSIVGGNQQGFIEYLDQYTTNDPSLYISAITGGSNPLVITSPNHNLKTGQIVMISGIPTGTPFASTLNGNVYEVILGDNSGANPTNLFRVNSYNSTSGQFSTPTISSDSGYIGGGVISVRDNFSVKSKKFNFLDEGQSIQLGFIDILMNATESTNPGAISINIYLDYNDDQASNTLPQNITYNQTPDDFFNQIIPTTSSNLNVKGGSKFWQRVYCATRANFLTLEYTFSNAQMNSHEQELDVQIDAQVLWVRKGGRMTQ